MVVTLELITESKEIFSRLFKGTSKSANQGFDTMTEDDDENDDYFDIPDLLLKSPLERFSFSILKDKDNYYGGMSLYHTLGEKPKERRKLIGRSKSRLLKTITDFSLIECPNGILFMHGKTPMFALDYTAQQVDNLFQLHFGEAGTSIRKINEKQLSSYQEQFSEDMRRFIDLMQKVINSCYQTPPEINFPIYI